LRVGLSWLFLTFLSFLAFSGLVTALSTFFLSDDLRLLVAENVYAFVNLGMAGLVMATVAVRFVFPGVSSEGGAFWIVRTAPVSLRDFLWSKFWIGLVPVLVRTEALTVAGNHLLGVDPVLKVVAAVSILVMSFALVGLATGLGARYPRFSADNPSQVAGSYGGIAFMVMAALFVLVVAALVGWASSVYLFLQGAARTARANRVARNLRLFRRCGAHRRRDVLVRHEVGNTGALRALTRAPGVRAPGVAERSGTSPNQNPVEPRRTL
jgi:hypothetical protein